MVEPVDDERMKRLETRIAAVRKANEPKPKSQVGRQMSQANMAWRMVTELVAGLLIGLGIGYTLDVWIGSLPLFLVLFAGLGFAAGVRVMLRTAREIQKSAEAAPPADREGT